MVRLLKKQDTLITLYDRVYEDDFYFIIKITACNGSNVYYKQWMEFKNELDELLFTPSQEDWICLDEDFKDRIKLKNELESRGFKVKLSGIEEYEKN